MSASIRYTNAIGAVTSFDAASPSAAIERLGQIRGYNATPIERAAVSAFRGGVRRMPIEANVPQQKLGGASVGFQSHAGRLTRSSRVADVKIVDGKLVKVMEDGYASESGSFFPTGTHESAVESE